MPSKTANQMVGNATLGLAVGAGQSYACSIGGMDMLPQPLSYADEYSALLRKNKGDLPARNMLVVHNLRLVIFIARRYRGAGIHIEDLISVGTMGLIKAVNTFKFGRNAKLATYASRCIENEILMAIRRTRRHRTEISLSKPIAVDWNGNELLLSDTFSSSDDSISRNLERIEERRLLHEAIRTLNPRERRIIELRFGLSGGFARTQRETADIVGTSQSYISKLEKRICKQLYKSMLPDFPR